MTRVRVLRRESRLETTSLQPQLPHRKVHVFNSAKNNYYFLEANQNFQLTVSVGLLFLAELETWTFRCEHYGLPPILLGCYLPGKCRNIPFLSLFRLS